MSKEWAFVVTVVLLNTMVCYGWLEILPACSFCSRMFEGELYAGIGHEGVIRNAPSPCPVYDGSY